MSLPTKLPSLGLTANIISIVSMSGKPTTCTDRQMIDTWIELLMMFTGVSVFAYIMMKVTRLLNNQELKARDIKKGHHWNYNSSPFPVSHCNICERFMISTNGAFCEACGVCVDEADCVAEANSLLPCKAISTTSPLKHHFTKGNFPQESFCVVCDEECGTEFGLVDVRCCWCQRCVHAQCLPKFGEVCDLGRLKKFIVPPTHVNLMSTRLRKQFIVEKVSLPNIENWSPVIVIGNSSAGSNDCEYILPAFRLLLNSAQVVDLSKKTPEEALRWCGLLPFTTCRIIVAGGDGTVGWVFNTIHKLKLKKLPLVSILPLGTGNDLSRVLGWGDGHTGTIDAYKFLLDLDRAKPCELDRWNVTFRAGLPMPHRSLFMNNYLSIGVDALVTLNFHKTRQSPFYLIQHRLINKFIYFSYGTKDVLMQECKDLQDKVEVWMDGKKVKLPCFESLVVLNIPCWGAGVLPWKMGAGGQQAPDQHIDDQILEVFCVNSSFHIAKLQMGVTEPVRLGQCKSIDIRLKGRSPMQVDGEPWEQNSGILSIRHSHSAQVLINKSGVPNY